MGGMCSAKVLTDDHEQLVDEMKKMFAEYDTDGSGEIDVCELGALIAKCNGGQVPSEDELAEAKLSMDKDGQGTVSWDEFKHWFFDEEEYQADNSNKQVDDEVAKRQAEKHDVEGTALSDAEIAKQRMAQMKADAEAAKAKAAGGGDGGGGAKEDGEAKAADDEGDTTG